MYSSAILVGVWIQVVLCAAALLLLCNFVLRWFVQPVERIRLIQFTLIAVLAVPIMIVLAPWPTLRLGLISPTADGGLSSVRRINEEMPSAALNQESLLSESSEALDLHPQLATSPAEPLPIPSREVAGESAASARPARLASANIWTAALILIVVVHVAALGYFLAEWCLGAARLRRLVRSAAPASDHVHATWSAVTRGRGRFVRLLVSPAVDTPLTFGWLRPVVVIPEEIASARGDALRFCLAHEWSHVERADLLSWRCVWCCQFLLWYQPLFWSLRRELRICQDVLADNRATEMGRESLEYSELLMSFARKRFTPPLAGALMILDHPSQLARRVRTLLQRPVTLRLQCRWTFSMAVSLLAAFAAVLLSGIRLDSARADNPEIKQDPPAPAIARPVEVKSQNPAGQDKPAETKSQPAVTQDNPVEKKDKPAEPPIRLSYTAVVVDKVTGKGIPGASVVVRRSILTSQEHRIIEETKHTTDEQGKYSFEIPPEQVAIGSLYIELDVDHENYAAQKGFGYALGMIRKNETLGERPFFERVELNAAEPVTGTVLAPDGRPLAGVKILGFSKANPGNFREYGSFTSSDSSPDGKFRLNLIKGGEGVFWILPKDFAIVQNVVGKKRGELGEIRLQPGIRVTGRVLSAEGKPLSGVAVNIDSDDREYYRVFSVSSRVQRGAISDNDGRVAFDPLPAGDYGVSPEEHLSDPLARDRTVFPMPGVFLAKKLTLKEGAAPPPLEIQAAPQVVFHAQYLNAKGEKTAGHEVEVFGRMDGEFWVGRGRPDPQGTIALRIPHGLQQVRVHLMTNEHGSLRFRRGPGKPLENYERSVTLGTLNDDVEGFEIVRYRAPVVLVKAVDEDGTPIKGFRVTAKYPWGKQLYVLEGGQSSDLVFRRQDDGRFRTSEMLPDEEVEFTAAAAGYQPSSEKLKLAEGESKELVLKLKKDVETKQE